MGDTVSGLVRWWHDTWSRHETRLGNEQGSSMVRRSWTLLVVFDVGFSVYDVVCWLLALGE